MVVEKLYCDHVDLLPNWGRNCMTLQFSSINNYLVPITIIFSFSFQKSFQTIVDSESSLVEQNSPSLGAGWGKFWKHLLEP